MFMAFWMIWNRTPKKRNSQQEFLAQQRLERLQARNAPWSDFYPDTAQKTWNILELSPKAEEIQQAITKHNLWESVTVDNSKVTVQIEWWTPITFAFDHTEWNTKFKNANTLYSKEQLDELVKVFGNKPAPYLEILGMKNTHEDDWKWNDYNFYWSSSPYGSLDAWGLFLSADDVGVGCNDKDYGCSAICPQNS
jgi:hypothetical protein